MFLIKNIAGADQPFFKQSLFLKLVENSPQATFVADDKGLIVSVNQAGLDFFGYTESQLLGQPLTVLMLPTQQSQHIEAFSRERRADHVSKVIGKTIELPARKHDGSSFDISLTVNEYSENQQKYYIGHITDISNIVKKQHEVENINHSLSSILNHSKDFIFLMDHQGVFLEVFTASKEHLFLPYEKIVGSHYRQCLPPLIAERLDGLLSDPQVQYKEQIMEYSNVTSSGEVIYYQATINAFTLPNQESGFIVIVRDVTELKNAKHAAEKANQDKTNLLRTVAHNGRIVLNNIAPSAKNALDPATPPADVSRYSEYLFSSIERLMKMFNSYLELDKFESHQLTVNMAPVDLNVEVTKLVSPFFSRARAQEIDFSKTVKSSVSGEVICDWDLISQILLNLLSNAMKFTQKRGQISVTISVEKKNDTEADLKFAVSDTGPGISAENIQKLFEAFSQFGDKNTKDKGTGLGLTLSQIKAQLMGGKITVHSEVGKGSTFTLIVPIKTAPVSEVKRANGIAQVSAAKDVGKYFNNRMVLIEDDEITTTIMEMYFKNVGFSEFVVISSEEEFQDFLKQGSFEEHSLFIVDKDIGGLAGGDVVQELRKLLGFSKKTIVMNSGDNLLPIEKETWGKQLDGFLIKSGDYDEFVKTLDALGRQRSANP